MQIGLFFCSPVQLQAGYPHGRDPTQNVKIHLSLEKYCIKGILLKYVVQVLFSIATTGEITWESIPMAK